MSERIASPGDQGPSLDGKGGPSHLAVQSVPTAPATTTDLSRFPEELPAGEITSLLGGEEGQRTPTAAKGDEAASPKAGPGMDFDPQIRIERRIGQGGMGEVFLGYQKHLDRKVAVKRIRGWQAEGAERERFIQEAKAQSRLQHAGIAQVYDFRESGDAFYLIMEYVPGRTLEEHLAAEGKLPPDRIVEIGIQLSNALESAAHEGYIHRDLKPGNVILTDEGRVKIIDFGLALRFRNLMQTRFTQKGSVLGTPAYMSPEQLNQEEALDVRSDLWSLGVLLYALATGSPPFTGKDFACTLRNVMIADPAPLPTIEPGFPPALWLTIARALRKDRAERWPDYASFREALRHALSKEEEAEPRPGPEENRAPRVRRRALHFGLGILGLLAVGAFLLVQLAREPRGAQGGEREESKEAPPTTKPPQILARTELGEKAGELPLPDAPLLGVPKPQSPEPKPLAASLRQQLVQYPVSAEDVRFVGQIQAAVAKHRQALIARSYGALLKE
ncbi:MAG: serine/threonine protein kinase, partial [Planctomycetaceae bacterium]|nr:serine/threonine protein kinase [Planctomycetaceae bacterium]